MQKTRPRRKGKQTAPAGDAEQKPTVGRGRPTHVRNRLIVAVAVVAAAIAGAGAPSVIAASGQLHDSQNLVTLAERTQDALALAHSLADERDEVVPYIAAGRPESKAPSEEHSARVDRQVEELRADTDTSEALREELDAVAAVRRAALTGKTSALEAHQAYSTAVNQLHRLAGRLAERTPPRAGSGAHALAELDAAVQQAAATRGLLLAALTVPRGTETVIDPITGLPSTSTSFSDADAEQRDELTAAALQARLRSDAALADFREAAPASARTSYDATVNGPEVDAAEKYLARLTDRPTLSDSELDTSTKKLRAALTARIETMRGAEFALFDQRAKDLAQLRDDDVTELEIRIAALGALMLLAVGVATAMARTLTRPLSVLRRGSARLAEAEDPAGQEPVAFTGRNDEFAQVVRSVNALHAHAARLAERIATLEADRKHLVGQRQKMADAREELRTELAESTAHLERLRAGIGGTFVNLALRTLGLVERQLGVIESLEEREDDPDRLATLFKLDHFATVMRRHSENLLVLAGTEQGRHTAGPVPLVDVVRAAVSEIERYDRVRIAALPPHAHIAGFAADDLSHLLAELMENATSFSPPDLPVEVSGWLLENGEVMLSVQDEGIGMAADRLERLNARLSEFDPETTYDTEGEDGLGLGLYVVARLAHRHGVRVRLREQKQGGIAAVVVLPDPLLAPATPTAVPASVPGASHTVSLPGANAEANSNVLHGRTQSGDPLVALAERAVEGAAPGAGPADDLPPGGVDGPAEDHDDALAPGREGGPGKDRADAEDHGPDAATGDTGGSEPAPADAPAEDRAGGAVTGRDEPSAPGPAQDAADAGHADQAARAQAPAGTDGAPQGREADAPAGHPGTAEPSDGAAGDEGAGAPPERPAETTMELLIPAQPDPAAPVPPSSAADQASPRDTEPGTAVGAGTRTTGTEPSGSGGGPDVAAAHPATAEAETARPGAGHEPASEIRGPSRPAGTGAVPADPGHGSGTGSAAGEVRPAGAEGVSPGAGHASVPGPARPADADDVYGGAGHGFGDEPVAGVTRDAGGVRPGGGHGTGDEPVPGAPRPAGDARPGAGDVPPPPRADAQPPRPEHARVADEGPVTAKGLPKRTPKISAPVAAPRPRAGSVDAEALRRRLGGFRQGADAGRRDVEAEMAERSRTGRHQQPDGTGAPSEEATGGTVEEASS
ncbi:nitrate- and nitrite sensing domain-containing protein [Streptomyces pilosus]|uniref:nitrate- and nitrite sensing domain-containing protein n=1 Tax=Streptomyces pilosus TaxID=28893 RepID=UPI00364152B2